MNEPIENKTPQVPGILPKHVQSWILIGLAVLMVLIMWLTGGRKPQPAAKAPTQRTPAEAPIEVNQMRLNELQNRIAELQHQQMVAENSLQQQTRLLGVQHEDSQPNQQQPGPSGVPEQTEDVIHSEHKKREYLSLFASNVALSYRQSPVSVASTMEPEPNSSEPSQIPESNPSGGAPVLSPRQEPFALVETAPHQEAGQTARTLEPPSSETKKEEAPHPAAAPAGIAATASGNTYLVLEGTVLETILINRLEGQFSGPVECLLTTDVYSDDRQHLLIPKGTRLLGETRRVDNSGQTRLAVVFHRLVMPDGYSVTLDQFQGLDQIGDTGLRDKVNNHYLRLFGASLAVGSLGAVAGAGTPGALTASGTDLMRQGFASTTSQSASQILDHFLNIPPTITIREGYRMKVYLAGDLALPDYTKHTLPPSL
jgi:type IV secretory pathway VirB10-like protein